MNERVEEEVEALKAILMDEVLIKKEENGSVVIETDVFPATASDHSSQYVRITVVATLPIGYPDVSPLIELKKPKGLDESVLQTIEKEIKSKTDSLIGEPVIFELIATVREHLTKSNVPSCHCVICLYGFSEIDHFIKTQCYHYFHSHCLVSHITASENIFMEEQEKLPVWQRTNSFQHRCPICREVISVDMEALSKAAPPVERENAHNFELDENLLSLQKEMAALFKHQQSRGGIIDLEAEELKLLLHTNSVPVENESPGPSVLQTVSSAPETDDNSLSRRGFSRGRGNRGTFAAARKNLRHFYSASR